MTTAKPIHRNVAGAPFCIGQRVRVIGFTDETADVRYLGFVGVVVYFEYSCGCGQSYPNDPMIGIRIEDKVIEFWREELVAT